jgi:DNA-directed RNA polymerase subunit omega
MITDRLEQSITLALEKVNNNKYKLSQIVAKRANELIQGEDPLIDVEYEHYKESDIAILEIAQGKLDISKFD